MDSKRSRSLVAFVVAALFFSLPWTQAALARTASLLSGDITTNRDLLSQAHSQRRLIGSWHGIQPHVWVLGLDPQHQAHVYSTLQAQHGKLLHPLPGENHHHWLVQATQAGIREIMLLHDDATVALLPYEAKISPAIDAEVRRRQLAGLKDIALLILTPSQTPDERAAFIQLASQQLQQRLGSTCKITAKQTGSLVHINVCIEGAVTATAWAAAHPGVTWVDADARMRISNIAASTVIQNPKQLHTVMDGTPSSAPPEDILQGAASGYYPLWKAGLTGKNQVVATVDSGIDLDSCFFFDAHMPNVLNALKPMEGVTTVYGVQVNHTSIPKHRKVVELISVSGKLDTEGHGTHTAGSLAGAVQGFHAQTDAPLLGTGICPDCKLAVIDAGLDVPNDPNIYSVPEEVYHYLEQQEVYQYFEQQVGVRILSSSIATLEYTYIFCYNIDAAAFSGDSNMLHVYAAGNEGVSNRYLRNTNGTVASLATCKNVLGVGATEGWQSHAENAAQAVVQKLKPFNLLTADGKVNTTVEQQYVSSLTLPTSGNTTNPGLLTIGSPSDSANPMQPLILNGSMLEFDYAPGWGSHFWQSFVSEAQQFRLVLADPLEGCNLRQSFDSTTDSVMLVVKKSAADINGDYDDLQRTCSPLETSVEAKNAGALAVLLYWEDFAYTTASFGQPTQPFYFPMPMLYSTKLGNRVVHLLAEGHQLIAEWQYIPPWRPMDALPFENIAFFSGYAPLSTPNTNRIKPDLVAPGYLLSAYSDKKGSNGTMDHCAVVREMGTSMATPVISGAAALARQYFTDGFYPTGAANSHNAIDPSMALLKAVLIAGTAAMTGYSLSDGNRLDPPPSPFQGFGRLDLSSSLPLASMPEWKMQMVDNARLNATGSAASYSVHVLASTEQGSQPDLIVTLMWNDYPGFPASLKPLVNDLDLTVQGPGTSPPQWGNGRTGGDRANNVEKVIISQAEPGLYTITITAHYLYIQASPQAYTLVVLGHISTDMTPTANPLPVVPTPSTSTPGTNMPGSAPGTTPGTMPGQVPGYMPGGAPGAEQGQQPGATPGSGLENVPGRGSGNDGTGANGAGVISGVCARALPWGNIILLPLFAILILQLQL